MMLRIPARTVHGQVPAAAHGVANIVRRNMPMYGRGISSAETSKQSSRGAVLVQNTCDWDTLATAVVRRSQTAHCSHLRSRVSVGLEAAVTGGG